MITKTTAANFDEFYAPRFAEITEALHANGHPELNVTSLEEYFRNIQEIGALKTNKNDVGKYLVVPFDEPYFEIDANTRIINVPDHFKKYGVGVYGDNTAEMLVFKVDRYFDHQDFFETNAYISWSFTPKGSRTPVVCEAPQLAFAMDDELEPGYVVFGFIITREMAKNAEGKLSSGTLNFAVSFYLEQPNEEVTYAWNTIPASVNINEGLELKNPNLAKDLSRQIVARLKNSAYTPDGIAPVVDPVWVSGDYTVDPLSGQAIYKGLFDTANFHINDNGVEDDELVLSAQAYSDALSTVKYTWFKYEPNEVSVPRDSESVATTNDFMITIDSEPVADKVYYINLQKVDDSIKEATFNEFIEGGDFALFNIKDGFAVVTPDETMKDHAYYKHVAGVDNMVKINQEQSLITAFADEVPVYELGSSLTVTSCGRYAVRAQAEKEISGTAPEVEPEEDNSVLKITAKKVPGEDLTTEDGRPNQAAVNIIQQGNNVIIVGQIDNLSAFASSAPGQGTHKWVAIDLATTAESITDLTWRGSRLTQDDVDEAALLNLGAGHIIYYAKADEMTTTPTSIAIGRPDTDEVVTLKFSFVDSGDTAPVKGIVAKSHALDSNICVVPEAATPIVALSVESMLEDDFTVEDDSEGYIYINDVADAEHAPRVIATVTSDGEPLGAIALEAVTEEAAAIVPSNAEIEAATKTSITDDTEGHKYLFKMLNGDAEAGLLPGQDLVSPDGIVAEGIYRVRAINRRNHDYAVSEPSEEIRTSFVAHVIDKINVSFIDGGASTLLIDKGEIPEYASRYGADSCAFVRLTSDDPVRTLIIAEDASSLADHFTKVEDGETVYLDATSYFLEEIYKDTDGTYKVKTPGDDSKTANKLVDELEVVLDSADGKLKVMVDDPGIYRIRVENRYNGTLRVGYTARFEILAQ